jgi:hypothetical protein
MNEIVIQIPIYKTAVLIYWGDRKGLYKAVKRNSDKATAKTTIFPNHKGKRSPVWAETKQMARDLNKRGISVSSCPRWTRRVVRTLCF